jgi:hypothetical protein
VRKRPGLARTRLTGLAKARLIPNSKGTLRTCANSRSGAAVFCVEQVVNLPTPSPDAQAVTYGHYIFCDGTCTALLSHELVHVEEWEPYGDRFAVLYALDLAKGNGSHCSNRYEREAYNASGGGSSCK